MPSISEFFILEAGLNYLRACDAAPKAMSSYLCLTCWKTKRSPLRVGVMSRRAHVPTYYPYVQARTSNLCVLPATLVLFRASIGYNAAGLLNAGSSHYFDS